MEHILIVEDEVDLLDLLEYNLKQAGYAVDRAEDGTSALALIRKRPPDLVVLDVMLPDILGLEVLKTIRRYDATARLPVILLTARNAESEVVEGFEMGADDYVPKPFSPSELLARIRALLSRVGRKQTTQDKLSFGELLIDLGAQRVRIIDKEVNLAPQEYKLLAYLATHPERVLTRDELLSRVWDEDVYVEPRTVDVHIRRLRSHLEKTGVSAAWIETVRGSGYRFNPSPGEK